MHGQHINTHAGSYIIVGDHQSVASRSSPNYSKLHKTNPVVHIIISVWFWLHPIIFVPCALPFMGSKLSVVKSVSDFCEPQYEAMLKLSVLCMGGGKSTFHTHPIEMVQYSTTTALCAVMWPCSQTKSSMERLGR